MTSGVISSPYFFGESLEARSTARNAAASSLASFVYVLAASGGTFIIRGEHGGVLSREPMNDGYAAVSTNPSKRRNGFSL